MDLLSISEIFTYIISGAGVGFLVGLTGVGGGSLMTPILILMNYPPHIAIGTDLMYAAATKAGGIYSHAKQATVNWQIVYRLALGSVPASVVTVYLLKYVFGDPESYQSILLTTLGVMLILTSLVILLRQKLNKSVPMDDDETAFIKRYQAPLTVIMGVVLGVCVTLSSVGAGAFGAAILLILYPRLNSVTIIGTDIAHAVPLTLIAGLGHMQLGNVDFVLLSCLLVGSLPAIHFGSKLSKRVPNNILQPILATILMIIGVKYAFF